jgi:hypothetical protein
MQYMKLADAERTDLLGSLASMSAFLHEQFASLEPEETRVPGPNDQFSPVEQVWHLADLEREGFGARIRRLREEPNPHLPDFDGTKVARARRYRELALVAGLREFEAARAANLAILRALPGEAWIRQGTLEGVGPISLCDLPALMRQHDEAHVAEIREWRRHAGKA